MKNAKVLGIMLIIAIICFIIALIVLILNTKQNEKEQANQQLNAEHMIILMKHAVYNLNSSEDLSNNSITDEAMIRFALSYMAVSDLDNVLYDEYGTIATVSVETIEQAVEHIFNRKINVLKPYMIIIVCVYTTISLLPIDYFIAKNNIDRYNRTGKIDVYYLMNDSTDNIQLLSDLYDKLENPQDKRMLKIYLDTMNNRNKNNKKLEYNISRQNAKKYFEKTSRYQEL